MLLQFDYHALTLSYWRSIEIIEGNWIWWGKYVYEFFNTPSTVSGFPQSAAYLWRHCTPNMVQCRPYPWAIGTIFVTLSYPNCLNELDGRENVGFGAYKLSLRALAKSNYNSYVKIHQHFPIITCPSFPTNFVDICYWQFHIIFTFHRQMFLKHSWNCHTSRSNIFLSNLTPLHFWLNHPRIAPDYISKHNENYINAQICTDWQLT